MTSKSDWQRWALFLVVGIISFTGVVPASTNSQDPWTRYHEAFATTFKNYDAARMGTVSIEGPSEVVRGSYGEWRIVYRAGSEGVAPGGAIRLTFRHLSGWGIPQNLDQGGPNFTTASTSDGTPVQLTPMQHFQVWNRYFLPFFPWQHVTEVKVTKRLAPGQTITLTLGDRSLGSPGLRAPSVARDRAWFLVFVDPNAEGRFIAIDKDIYVRVKSGPAIRLRVLVPSQAASGKPIDVQLRAEDSDGNVADTYRGTVKLDSGAGGTLPATYTFTDTDKGLHWFRGVALSGDGIRRIDATDGKLQTESNPILLSANAPAENIYWGDLHGHTIFSDGTGMPEQYFDFARNVAGLDFTALTDHIEMLDPVREKMISELVDRKNDPHHFATIHAYEWGGVTADGGHHNVYMLRADVPSFRSSNSQNDKNPFLYFGPPERGAAHVARLYEFLREQPGAEKGEIIVIPHDRGATATPQWGDPLLQRLVEVTSESGYHEQWAQTFFVPGEHLGFIGSSDDHYNRPGYGMDDRFDQPWNYTRQGSPVAAVIAPEDTRESIFASMYNRHTYATTGARIILRVSADGHESGDSYAPSAPPQFRVLVAGTAALKTVEIKKLVPREFEVTDPFPDKSEHAQIVYQHPLKAGEKDVQFTFTAPDLSERAAFYYVHVTQADGEQADSSPLMLRQK